MKKYTKAQALKKLCALARAAEDRNYEAAYGIDDMGFAEVCTPEEIVKIAVALAGYESTVFAVGKK